MNLLKTFLFWNKKENVQYFQNKPADPRVHERLLNFLKNKKQSLYALDHGCGGGRHTELLLNLGFNVTAIDINPAMIRCTKRRVHGNGNVDVRQSSILNLPFPSESFDVVVSTGVLHQAKNLSEYDIVIQELSRVLKPNGLACINIFTSAVLDKNYEKLTPAFVYRTKEGLEMTLLKKEFFYDLMNWHQFDLEEELSEDVVNENTGLRSVLRCNFRKKQL